MSVSERGQTVTGVCLSPMLCTCNPVKEKVNRNSVGQSEEVVSDSRPLAESLSNLSEGEQETVGKFNVGSPQRRGQGL